MYSQTIWKNHLWWCHKNIIKSRKRRKSIWRRGSLKPNLGWRISYRTRKIFSRIRFQKTRYGLQLPRQIKSFLHETQWRQKNCSRCWRSFPWSWRISGRSLKRGKIISFRGKTRRIITRQIGLLVVPLT